MDEKYILLEDRNTGEHQSAHNCSRCGEDHEHLTLYAFYRPITDHEDGFEWKWWMTCPTTGDPILVVDLPDGLDVADLPKHVSPQ